MIRILTGAFLSTVIAFVATSAEARRAISANGISLNGASASAPLAIVAIDVPEN